MSTILVIKKTESPDVVSAGNQMSGYQVQLEVTDSAGINPKIFIMQREVISAGDGGVYEDQFYSVASVAQLESVPEAPTSNLPFYRVSSVSLIFGTIEDREKYTSTILAMIENHRSGLVWRTLRHNPHIRRGLERAGFTGGWLETR